MDDFTSSSIINIFSSGSSSLTKSSGDSFGDTDDILFERY